jgi:hypothetical protein
MTAYLLLPYYFVIFWFVEAPRGIIRYFGSVNRAFFQLFSLPLLVRTFFQPIKNEYRKGLVGFSIGMGIAIKSVLIIVNLILFIPLLLLETFVVLGFVLFPFATAALLLV